MAHLRDGRRERSDRPRVWTPSNEQPAAAVLASVGWSGRWVRGRGELVRLWRFLRRWVLERYGVPGTSHAFVPSQGNLVLCAGCGKTLGAGDHDRRGDTTRPYGYGGGGPF
jgi:hypothetical protein